MPVENRAVRVLVIGVLVRDGWVLLEEYDGVHGHFYRGLGGGLDFGERLADAVVREFREELDAEVTIVRSLGVTENLFEWAGEPAHEVVHLFEIASPDLEAIGRDESVQILDQPNRARWFRIADLVAGDVPVFPDHLLDIITALDASR